MSSDLVGWHLAAILAYPVGIALLIWIFYLIIRTAVKNGILRADAVRAQRDGSVRASPDVSGDDAPVA